MDSYELTTLSTSCTLFFTATWVGSDDFKRRPTVVFDRAAGGSFQVTDNGSNDVDPAVASIRFEYPFFLPHGAPTVLIHEVRLLDPLGREVLTVEGGSRTCELAPES